MARGCLGSCSLVCVVSDEKVYAICAWCDFLLFPPNHQLLAMPSGHDSVRFQFTVLGWAVLNPACLGVPGSSSCSSVLTQCQAAQDPGAASHIPGAGGP